MHKHLIIPLLLLCSGPSLRSQSAITATTAPAPEIELRGAWIATVSGIDYPRQATTDAGRLRQQYDQLLDSLQRTGINTIFFQVRPAADAFYPSRHAPWSAFLSGRQGRAPAENFDPLAYMIAEAHVRGIEFHAWINPYRATINLDTSALSRDHAFYRHRKWLLSYGGKLYFDPGLPEVRQHLLDIVDELITEYELDGLHIDDYFYPYPVPGQAFPDSSSFRRYAPAGSKLADWRRSNTSALVRDLHTLVKQRKPWLAFGVSPFGVWRNQSVDPRGSATRAGVTTYDDLYADVLHWIEQGWIDYVAPQLYWHIGFAIADYQLLLDWWHERSAPTPVLVGHAIYKVDNDNAGWRNPAEIPQQIELRRQYAGSPGSIHFNAQKMLENRLGVRDSLQRLYSSPARWPMRPQPGLDGKPAAPTLERLRCREGRVVLRWRHTRTPLPVDAQPHYYAVYRSERSRGSAAAPPPRLLYLSPFAPQQDYLVFEDQEVRRGQGYNYFVVGVNRFHRVGVKSVVRTVKRVK